MTPPTSMRAICRPVCSSEPEPIHTATITASTAATRKPRQKAERRHLRRRSS